MEETNDKVAPIGVNARRWIYTVFAVGSVILGAVQVGYATSEVDIPTWVNVVTAVWVFLGGPQGLLARVNTPSQVVETPPA